MPHTDGYILPNFNPILEPNTLNDFWIDSLLKAIKATKSYKQDIF